MGANTPKTDLDKIYRRLAADFLREVMIEHDLNKTELAERLGVDRSVASRYLACQVRAPLQRLGYLYRTMRISVPRQVEDAFWDSESPPDVTVRKRA